MAVTNPCCCSLRLGTQIIAIFNIICSAILLVVCVIIIVADADSFNLANDEFKYGPYNEKGLLNLVIVSLVTHIILLIVSLISIGIGILLLIGAKKSDASKCRLWFNFTAVFLVVYILLVIINMTNANSETTRTAGAIGDFALIIFVLFELYQLWVVYAFIDEIKRRGSRQNAANSGVVYTQAPPYSAAPGKVYNPTTASQNEPATVKYPVLTTENA